MKKRNEVVELERHLFKLCLKANGHEKLFKESEMSKWSDNRLLEQLANEMRLLPEDVKRRLTI